MTTNDGLELLVFNSQEVQSWHFGLLAAAENEVNNHHAVVEGLWTQDEAIVYILADALKDRYEWMIDDIAISQIPLSNAFSKQYTKNANEFFSLMEFRADVVRDLVRDAFDRVAWHALASEIIRRRREGAKNEI